MLAIAVKTTDSRLPLDHNHSAHPNQSAAGASKKTPITETRLIATNGTDTISKGSFHRFHET